jgi:hypothetical protein
LKSKKAQVDDYLYAGYHWGAYKLNCGTEQNKKTKSDYEKSA